MVGLMWICNQQLQHNHEATDILTISLRQLDNGVRLEAPGVAAQHRLLLLLRLGKHFAFCVVPVQRCQTPVVKFFSAEQVDEDCASPFALVA